MEIEWLASDDDLRAALHALADLLRLLPEPK